MLESISIKLTRVGSGIAPEYSITIFDDGRVIYEGIDNVKVLGIVNEIIDESKVIDLLEELKKSGFFKFEKQYFRDDLAALPYNILSVTIRKGTGEVIEKSVTRHHGNKNAPIELIYLENRIDEITNSKKWIDLPIEIISDKKPEERIEKYKIKEPEPEVKKRHSKLIAGIIAGIIIILVIIYVLFSGVNNFLGGSLINENSKDYISPIIASLKICDYINESNKSENSQFLKGEAVYIYFSCENLVHNKEFNITEDVKIILNDNIFLSNLYPNAQQDYDEDIYSDYHSFITDETWPAGVYSVNILISDHISGKTANKVTNFEVLNGIKGPLEITTLVTASAFRGYRDYDPAVVFNVNDNITVYEEYTNISVFNKDGCDLFLEIIVTNSTGSIFHIDNDLKNIVGSNAHRWYFVTNSNWTSGVYYIQSNIVDNINQEIAGNTTAFYLGS